MAALERAIALAQVHSLTFSIAKDLNFNMAWGCKVFLDIDFVVAEVGFAFSTCCSECTFHVCSGLRHFHAFTTTTSSCFDDDRIAHFFADALRFFEGWNATGRTRNTWNAKRLHCIFSRDLVAHDADVFRCWTDEGQAMIFDNLYEVGVLRQETIAWVNRFSARDFASCDNRWYRQVGLLRRRWANTDTFVGHANVHGVCVGSGVNSD